MRIQTQAVEVSRRSFRGTGWRTRTSKGRSPLVETTSASANSATPVYGVSQIAAICSYVIAAQHETLAYYYHTIYVKIPCVQLKQTETCGCVVETLAQVSIVDLEAVLARSELSALPPTVTVSLSHRNAVREVVQFQTHEREALQAILAGHTIAWHLYYYFVFQSTC